MAVDLPPGKLAPHTVLVLNRTRLPGSRQEEKKQYGVSTMQSSRSQQIDGTNSTKGTNSTNSAKGSKGYEQYERIRTVQNVQKECQAGELTRFQATRKGRQLN